MKSLDSLEYDEQVAFVEWLSWQYPNVPWYAVPNGGSRHKIEAARLKAAGVRAGIPDTVFPVPMGPYHSLYIELKRIKGSRIDALQIEIMRLLTALGHKCVVAYGANEAIEAVEKYMAGKND